MFRLLFWNLNDQPLATSVAALAIDHDVDIIALAESSLSPAELLGKLNSEDGPLFQYPDRLNAYIHFYHRLPDAGFVALDDRAHLSVRQIVRPACPDVLMVTVHLSSKLEMEGDDQSQLATRLSRIIREYEGVLGHQRTLVIGDFNMSPFEIGMTSSESLHAISSRRIVVDRQSRRVQGEDIALFYNPMWSFLGDLPPGLPGTMFYDRSGRPINHYWHVFDQVLLRPELATAFDNDSVSVPTEIRGVSLLHNGVPDEDAFSNHLPLILSLRV